MDYSILENVKVELISSEPLYHTVWKVVVTGSRPFEVVITRYPEETEAGLLKAIKGLDWINIKSISSLDRKNFINYD